jgi:hypothetical protein
MADISKIGSAEERQEVRIEVPVHWADHRFMDRAVLPAVEAMQLLAFWTRRFRPAVHLHSIRHAAFDKFLEMPPTGAAIQAFCDLTDLPGGAVQACLVTRGRTGSAAITRTRIHARVVFQPAPLSVPQVALDLAAALAGSCFNVEPERLYEALVPFGPCYRNIAKSVRLTREGALAWIHAPEYPDPQTDLPLGSPFVADAAFHAACVWSQRFDGIIAFPVGIAERRIVNPTLAGETYIARVFPLGREEEGLLFDIWILDQGGGLRELLEGVRMRDVSGGRMRPPAWIGAKPADQVDPGSGRKAGAVMTLIERDTLMPFAGRCLTDSESRRLADMGPGRRNAFTAARLACKRLSRQIGGKDATGPAHQIETIAPDGIHPICSSGEKDPFYCSVAHDKRFAVAATAEMPVGVDVERPMARLV